MMTKFQVFKNPKITSWTRTVQIWASTGATLKLANSCAFKSLDAPLSTGGTDQRKPPPHQVSRYLPPPAIKSNHRILPLAEEQRIRDLLCLERLQVSTANPNWGERGGGGHLKIHFPLCSLTIGFLRGPTKNNNCRVF